MSIVLRIGSIILGVLALGLIIGGGQLVGLGGSWYYLLVGFAYLAAAVLLWRYRGLGATIVGAVAVLTIPWALWEVGLNYWGLFPRLMAPFVIAALVLLFVPWTSGAPRKSLAFAGAGIFGLAFVVLFITGFWPTNTIHPGAQMTYATQPANNQPSNWTAYGRTTRGDRFAPFDQINRSNVNQLELAWQYRTGDMGPGGDQNTPLQIDEMIYSCTRNDKVIALDADTGQQRWSNDPKASSPIWQRCRGLGYYHMASASGQPCEHRIVHTTIDARLIELDAKTGQACSGFGENGTVQLSQGMGPVKPGYYFQTSAPLVARDYIIVGGWVMDNSERGEPSGVIRAFDARSGALVWAWDLANPAITRDPPAGGTYTRGTPNSWSTASYDDALGLVYLPLGNATPDYYGVGRPPNSDEYNASLVALDVMTGRERWHFRTTNHDIWDYDVPAQPALMDLPDGRGGVVRAVLQTTKRGQIFLLNRETGVPIADVQQKPVPQNGAVPEERLAATQPYSVGMPTIGAQRLTEQRAWGATMFDQLLCRIQFRQLRYDGDYTPIGLTKALQYPANLGGMNWGSVSVDAANGRVYLNDLRVPNVFYLIPRAEYERMGASRVDSDGHGLSPQNGTPYASATEMWMSPLGIPCTQPPYGTVTAIDMKTRQIAWQVPAGTAEQLGPAGIRLGMPFAMGMPSYAGTMSTASGLVFFAGFQDYYLRAYDAETGREVWKYPLPVGSSATPMTYVSPKTGRQYVVISVGGAANSPVVGDYVMAFALPQRNGNAAAR